MLSLQKQKIQNIALNISANIISSFMHKKELSLGDIPSGYAITLYDELENAIYGDEVANVELKQGFYTTKDFDYYVDLSPQLHHDVKYLLIKTLPIKKGLEKLLWSVVFIAMLIVFIIAIVGYFLTKMFLKPIHEERIRLGEFIKDTTHELNTPITALLMSIERLKKTNTNHEILQRVELSAKRVQNIYEDLTYLLLAKNSTKKQNLNLKHLLEQELLLYELLAGKKGISIQKNLEDFYFNIDTMSASRLFSNLLSNAIKYAKSSSTVELKLKDATFSISNYGLEIKSIEKIFDRFYRASNTQNGYGLGLDIVRNICLSYNIKVDIKSNEYGFTTVSLVFM